MNLEQLKIFVAAAHHGSFTLAAASLGLTQSAISISMRKLEEAHDVVFFNRVGNGLSLTEAGRALLTEAERILADVELTVARIGTYRYAPKRRLLIACSRNAYDHWMPAVIANLQSRKDLPQIDITAGSSNDITSWVMRGTVDFGLTEATPGHSSMRYWAVFDDCLRLYARREIAERFGSDASWPLLEDIGPVLWECAGDLEPFVLNAIKKNRLREQRIRHSSLALRSLSAVYSAVATGRHAGYLTKRLAEGYMGAPHISAIPAFDIPIQYWLFGPHEGLGRILSDAIRDEAQKLEPSPPKEPAPQAG
ncbi:LysR family transcriptional regulator [Trinickia diaoshuihuensis]|uniref:LysR family transcriptional regulator n=1 Tax=Trinickia diaoshuihuensis TaxID=2292265 RepID=UPI000E22B3FA|nr:LysR family transcriptional regulator [Trinickia diaoshuihuensis]